MNQSTLWNSLADLPHELTYVDVGPWRTRVLLAGDGPSALVLLNGTSGHIEAYSHNIRALAEEHRVVAYDYPGHGYTTLATEPLEIPDYERHLTGLLDALHLQTVHLCGESLGGWIAVKYASTTPSGCAR